MDTKTLIMNSDISPKKIALIRYFRIVDLVEKSGGDVTKAIKLKVSHDIFSYEESKILLSKGKENIKVWNHIISVLLNTDTMAEKYYFQTVAGIFMNYFFENKDEQILYVRQSYFNYLCKAFSVALLNKIFYDLIDIQSPKFLITISDLEKKAKSDCCYLFRKEYFIRKKEIIKNARELIDEVANDVKSYEYISASLIDSFIDKTDQVFMKLL